MQSVETAGFEAALVAEGFEVATKSVPAGTDNSDHSHDFEVRALVTAGRIALTVEGRETSYEPGQVFTMAKGCRHRETVGPEGVTFVVGRRS